MKKRFLAATIAGICAVSALGTSAFAEGEVTEATTAAPTAISDSANEITVDAITSIPAINVKLPTQFGFVANPYRLTVKTGAGENDKSNSAIVCPELEIENLGHSRVAVSALGIGTAAGKADLVSLKKDSKGKPITTIDTKLTTNQIVLFVEPGVAKTDKDGNVTYSYSGKYSEKNCCLIGSVSTKAYFTVGTITKEEAVKAGVSGDAWDAASNAVQKAKELLNAGVTLMNGDTAVTDFSVALDTTLTDIEDVANSVIGTATEVTLLTLDNTDSTDAKAVKKGRIKISGDMNSNVDKDWADTDVVNVALKFNIKLLPNNVK